MSKHFIIVLLLFQLFHHGFAEDTDAMTAHTEALRVERLALEHTKYVNQEYRYNEVLSMLRPNQFANAYTLVPLVIKHMMKPLDLTFPSVVVQKPNAEMSQAELELHWELLGLTASLLKKKRTMNGMDSVDRLRQRYQQEMLKRLHDAMFRPSFAIEYSQGQTVDWISINMAFMSDFLRGDKDLYFLKHTNYSPVSSFTECDVLLNEEPSSKSAHDLYWDYDFFDYPEHMFYRMLYKKMIAQREEFIITACSRFLEQRENSGSPANSGLIQRLTRDIDRKEDLLNYHKEVVSKYMKQLSELHLNMPENVNGQLHLVTSEIVNLKREMARTHYQWTDTVAKISEIVAAASLLLGFRQQGLDLPFETTLLFELLPQNVCQTEISPYLALAAEYYLLLLWRCMQQLSLLVWFRGRYVIELLPENPSFTSEQINGAVTEIADMAEYALSVFDAYEKFAQWQTPLLSGEERQECLRLIVQGRNHLASTWQTIIDEHAEKYINAVNRALAHIQNFDISAGAELSSSIILVDGIPPEINHLISAEPVPANLPPEYLKLAASFHYLVAQRVDSAIKSEAIGDGKEINSKLWSYVLARTAVCTVYNDAAISAGVRVLPDMRDSSLWQVGSPSTVALRDQVSPNTDAQGDILDPTTSIHSGPYDSIETGLGTRTRAVSEASSRSGRRQNRRNRHAGGRSDVGPWGGPGGLE
ncbi:hypothetical protein SeLEV6574_g04002 [Synchytrium endobioticum]|uniref:Uncharacterized protein n=1 Tax=Synchytrium endobioticum TaxID=286115 RepID=A0A507D1U6_9FUNG|nr:hypothetical protein SeLEV6574_g04002 [Synchytrium endobioticum]